MNRKIYYSIKEHGSMFALISAVKTNFGGYAHNFVKADKRIKPLHDYARSQGWELKDVE